MPCRLVREFETLFPLENCVLSLEKTLRCYYFPRAGTTVYPQSIAIGVSRRLLSFIKGLSRLLSRLAEMIGG